VLWHTNFEEASFSHEELVEVANTFVARSRGKKTPISVDELKQAAAENPKKGIASVLVKVAKGHKVRIRKPAYAVELARYTLQHQEHQGQTRPLMALAEHLVRLTGADRQLAGRLRQPRGG
jgi:hypothetical protein